MNINLPLTAGKGSPSLTSFGQEGSKRNCKTARSAVSGLGLGSEKEIAMWELSIWVTQNNSKGQITNSRQSADKPPPFVFPYAGFPLNFPSLVLGEQQARPLPTRGAASADSSPYSSRRREVRSPRATAAGRPSGSPEPAGPGRPRALPAPIGHQEAAGGGGGPRAASAGRRGEAGRGRRVEGGGRCILGNPPTWGEAAAAAAASPGRGCRPFPDAQPGLAPRRGRGSPGTDWPARPPPVCQPGPCEGAAPSAAASSSSSSPDPPPSRPLASPGQ